MTSIDRRAFTALGATVMLAGAARAQTQPTPPPAPPLIDWEKIQIKTTDLGHNTYMLEGQGGNITVAVGTDGVIMVDTQFAPLHDKIKAAIAKISPQPVKYVINTHYTAITSTGMRCSTRRARPLWPTTTCASAWLPAPPTCSTATRC